MLHRSFKQRTSSLQFLQAGMSQSEAVDGEGGSATLAFPEICPGSG